MEKRVGIAVCVTLLLIAILYARFGSIEDGRAGRFRRDTHTNREVVEHSREFENKEVIQVNSRIYVAIGFALANSIMLVGDDGVVIVDVTESLESAAEIYEAFRNITTKPITDIIYTHNHADHVNGAQSFIKDGQRTPNIWAHENIKRGFDIFFSGPGEAHIARSLRQFGVFVPNQVSAGIGPRLLFGRKENLAGPVFPNKFIKGEGEDVILSGMKMSIVFIPGETDDQIGVWLPDQRVFLCADDLYRAFPNLYAIRGTKPRSLKKWVSSLDKIIDLNPATLVPSHTRPVDGEGRVMKLLTEYRDAIQYVHDQTLRYINYGYHPDEIANMIKLPQHLASNERLKEFYGTVKWSSKGVFIEHEGWFSGDPVDIDPLTRGERAARMVEMIGEDKMLNHAQKAFDKGDWQWALELTSYITRADANNKQAKELQIETLIALSSKQISNNGANYYMTYAMELNGLEIPSKQASMTTIIHAFPIDYLMEAFPRRFKPETCLDRSDVVQFIFTNPESAHHIQLRNGVAILRHAMAPHSTITVRAEEKVWKDLVAQERTAVMAIASGDLIIEGGALTFRSFMDCFDRDIQYKIQ